MPTVPCADRGKRNVALPWIGVSSLIVRVVLFGLALLLGGAPEAVAQREHPPNVLLITADDLGLQLGAYGDAMARTPHLDRLARRGVRFDRAYVTQASCSPSRSSILTGLYPHQNGQVGLANRGYYMHRGYTNLPRLLKDAGYRTGLIGKLHVKPFAAFPFDYQQRDAGATLRVREVAARADSFFRAAPAEPFFLMVNYFDPHRPFPRQVEGLPEDPFEAAEVAALPFNGLRTPEALDEVADYYSSVARLDAGVGMLLERLEETGRAENTLVIFVSDHGPPFARAKTSNYEAGVRVPLMVRGPGQAAAGNASKRLVSTVDLLPTVLDAAGLDRLEGRPGHSLLPLLAGKAVEWREAVFAEYTAHTRDHYYPRRSIRKGRYKLILNLLPEHPFPDFPYVTPPFEEDAFTSPEPRRAVDRAINPPKVELYDLQRDPMEFNNLADRAAYQNVKNELLERLEAWRLRTRDPMRFPSILQTRTRRHDAPSGGS